MQIICLILLFFLFPGSLSGGAVNLLQEWEKPAAVTPYLPQWRFGNWGKGQNSRKNPARLHKVQLKDGKLSVILENKTDAHSANILLRSYLIKTPDKRLFRFKVKAENSVPGKALLRIRLSSSGSRYAAKEKFFSVASAEVHSVDLTVPEKSKTLSIQICLSGPGRIILTDARLTAEEVLSSVPSQQCVLPEGSFLIPERTPVLFPVKLPFKRSRLADNFLTVTLPWGIRLINSSYPAAAESVKVIPGKSTAFRFKLPAKRVVPDEGIYLLLGSDLPASEKIYTGSLSCEGAHGKSDALLFHLQIIKELSVLPPRNFQIMINANERASALESRNESDDALLRSGANILNAPALSIPFRTLKNVHIKQYCDLALSPVPAKKQCFYASIRDESFWGKYFVPDLRRRIFRQQSSSVQALLCDSYLGQRRGIECLCALCRAELADFSPKLPPQAVVNYSTALLNSRFAKELHQFRRSRLTALYEGARYHLPTGKGAFTRKPKLIPCYPNTQILAQSSPLISTAEAAVDFQRGAPLPDGVLYNGAANAVLYEAIRKKMKLFLPRGRIMAKITPSPKYISPDKVQFETLNILFSGYAGAWISLPPGASWDYRSKIAETADLIREYEKFFALPRKNKGPWHLTQGDFSIELPPIPGAGLYRLETPQRIPGLQLRVWEYGKETLIGIGNFSELSRSCRLENRELAGKKEVMLNGQKISGKVIEKGFELTLPPYSWKFLRFTPL